MSAQENRNCFHVYFISEHDNLLRRRGEEGNLKRTSNHLGGDLSTINNENQTLTDSFRGIKRTASER